MRQWTVVVALSLAAAAALASETRWVRVSTAHFVVSGDAPAAELERTASRLESLRGVLTEVLPRTHDDSLLPAFVIAFGNDTSFAPYQPPGVVVGGYAVLEPFTPCMVLRSARSEEAFRTIVHEYVHVMFDASWVPAWLSEGVADYFGTTSVSRDGRRVVLGDRIQEHITQASSWWIPLSHVLARERSARLSNDNGSKSFYAESWLLVHYLTRATPAKGAQIARFLDLLSAGASEAAAFEDAIGPTVRIEEELRRYLGNGIIRGEERTLTAGIDRVQPTSRPMTNAEVDATLGRLLFHLRRDDEAMAHLRTSTEVDPNLPDAAITLGVMLVRQGRRVDAVPHFLRANVADPTNLYAAYQLGVFALDAVRFAGAPTLEDAHAALGRAVSGRPEAPPKAMAMLGTLAGRLGRLEEAEPLLRGAVSADAGHADARLELANVIMRRGTFEEARQLLSALSADAAYPNTRAVKQCLAWLPMAEARAAILSELAEIAGLRNPSPDPAIAKTGSFPSAPRLRAVGAGEERRLGLLEAVDCGDTTFNVRVSTRSGPLRFTTASLGTVHVSSARNELNGSLPCGPRLAREAVYVTWNGDGQLVAIEVLPADVQPQDGGPVH